MKAIQNTTNATTHTLLGTCIGLCQKVVVQIEKTKNAILNEFAATRQANAHLLELALNEAEAIAWQTPYPQLFFPVLAVEKAQAVVNWQSHQQAVLAA